MKKPVLIVCIAAAVFASCATQVAVEEEPEGTEGIPLQEVIEQSAAKLAAELPAGTRVAIAAFSSEHGNLSEYIMDELTGVLWTGILKWRTAGILSLSTGN